MPLINSFLNTAVYSDIKVDISNTESYLLNPTHLNLSLIRLDFIENNPQRHLYLLIRLQWLQVLKND